MNNEVNVVADLWVVLGGFAGTLLLLLVILIAGKNVIIQGRKVWLAVRGYEVDLVGVIDDPADPVIKNLERYTPIPAKVWIAFLPAFVHALADGLDKAMGIPSDPESETPTETIKPA